MKYSIQAAAFLAAAFGAGTASAGDLCHVPKSEWQTVDALQEKLKTDGWTVKKIKTEDGCYEAYAIDAEGRKVEAYFDPKTFEIAKLKTRD